MALQRTLPDDAGRTAPTGSIRQWCNLVGCTGIHWREDSDDPALVSFLRFSESTICLLPLERRGALSETHGPSP